MSLEIHNLSFAYDQMPILKGVDVHPLQKGQLTILLGPNAAGKSTFFKSVAGLVNAQADSMLVDGLSLSDLSMQQRAELVCYMPQQFSNNAVLTVFDVVLLAYKQFGSWHISKQDVAAVNELLASLGIQQLANRHICDLSGGQQQLVSLCQSLSRKASLFLLDEPTSALDLHRQHQVMSTLKQHAVENEVVCIIALHDLNLAASYADTLLLMDNGEVVMQGSKQHVLESPKLAEIYQLDIELLRNKHGDYVISSSL